MDKAGDRPDQSGPRKEGQPGTEDQFARGAGAAGAPDVGADLGEEEREDTSAAGRTADDDGMASRARTAADGMEGATSADPGRELAEQRDKYLRLAAEYDNFRKRTQRERLDAGTRAQAELVRQILDAVDDLARFAEIEPESTDTGTVVEGVRMVDRKLAKSLTGAGLEILNPVDQTFDPAVHEAVATEPALSSEDDNLVARVYQQGYVFKGLLLRPARVVVKQWNG